MGSTRDDYILGVHVQRDGTEVLKTLQADLQKIGLAGKDAAGHTNLLNQAWARFGQTAGAFKSAAGDIASRVSVMGVSLAEVAGPLAAAAAGAAVAAGAFAALRDATQKGIENEENIKGLIALTGSYEAAAQRMRELQEQSKNSDFSIPSLAAADQQLRLFGLDASRLLPEVSRAAGLMGASVEDVTRAIDMALLGQTKGLKRYGIDAMAIARETGIALDGQNKLTKAQNEKVIDAIVEDWRTKFKDAPDTVKDQLQHIENRLDIFKQRLYDAGIGKVIHTTLSFTITAIDKGGAALSKAWTLAKGIRTAAGASFGAVMAGERALGNTVMHALGMPGVGTYLEGRDGGERGELISVSGGEPQGPPIPDDLGDSSSSSGSGSSKAKAAAEARRAFQSGQRQAWLSFMSGERSANAQQAEQQFRADIEHTHVSDILNGPHKAAISFHERNPYEQEQVDKRRQMEADLDMLRQEGWTREQVLDLERARKKQADRDQYLAGERKLWDSVNALHRTRTQIAVSIEHGLTTAMEKETFKFLTTWKTSKGVEVAIFAAAAKTMTVDFLRALSERAKARATDELAEGLAATAKALGFKLNPVSQLASAGKHFAAAALFSGIAGATAGAASAAEQGLGSGLVNSGGTTTTTDGKGSTTADRSFSISGQAAPQNITYIVQYQQVGGVILYGDEGPREFVQRFIPYLKEARLAGAI